MLLNEPLHPVGVKKLILAILATGTVSWSKHALDEMAGDNLTTVDVVNVLRAGAGQPGEFENGSWRYRVSTQRLTVVVAFRSQTHLVVVTAWRDKR